MTVRRLASGVRRLPGSPAAGCRCGRAVAQPTARPLSAGAAGLELSSQHLLEGASGEPVLVMHGLLGNKMNWRSLFRAGPLAQLDRDVIVADARNHGISPHAAEMSYDAMVDDTLRLLDAHAIERVAAVGHSMGGKTAMHLALRAPERVSRLVVCDIAPVTYTGEAGPSDRSDSTFIDVFTAMDGLDLASLKSRGQADEALTAAIPADGLRAFVLTNLKMQGKGKERKLEWRCNLPALQANVANIMAFPATPTTAPYPGPTLFIGGADSNYISAKHTDAIERLFPKASVTHVAGAGHFVHVDQPAAVCELIADFIQES